MLIAAAFWLFLASSLAVIWIVGGKEGKLFAAACALATVLTFAANALLGFVSAEPVLLLVDVGLSSMMALVAVKSKSFWPIWVTGSLAIAVASRFAALVFSAPYASLYGNFAAFWALPALGAAVAGVLLDRRAGLVV